MLNKFLTVFSVFFVVCFSGVGQSIRPGVGAMPYADATGTGITFRVWAPNATSVTVAGNFNGWNNTVNPLVADPSFGAGYWSADLTNAYVGAQYKYVIDGTLWRKDPRALKVVNSSDNAIVFDPSVYQWEEISYQRPDRKDLVLYEMHIRTFNPYNTFSPAGTFDSALEKLPYLHELGVNAIQLMPIAEFPGDRSWGYNPADPYAVESAYGGPEGFQRFVDTCHALGISVFIDIVHNHWGPSDLSTWQFDGCDGDCSHGGIYHYSVAGRCCTPWGDTRPDYSRQEVRDYIKDNYRMWIDEYNIDGFRTDSPYHMYYYDGGTIPEAATLQQEINSMIHNEYSGILSIQENGEANWGYDSRWDMTFLHGIRDLLAESNDAARDMNHLAWLLGNGAGLGRVLYLESHDTAGDLNGGTRITQLIDPSTPNSYWAKKRSLLGAALVLTAPGTPMILQGEEMAEHLAFSDGVGFRWENTSYPEHAGHIEAYTDLIHTRRNLRGGTQGLEGSGLHVHHIDDSQKVIAYKRWDAGGGVDDVVVVMNFSVEDLNNDSYYIEFPTPGDWYVHFNSDASEYGVGFNNIGSSMITATGTPARAAVNIAKYSALVFAKAPPSFSGESWVSHPYGTGCEGTQTIFYDATNGPLATANQIYVAIGHDGWQAPITLPLTQSPSNPNLWQVDYSGFPGGTHAINYAFNDGMGTWDNNETKDWYALINCDATASFNPSVPYGCTNITIRYESGTGPLANANAIMARIGQNEWESIVDLPMVETTSGVWEVDYQIIDPAFTLHVAFHDNQGTWDTNQGNNWNTWVDHCHTNAGNVVLHPFQPNGCDPITVYFDPETGPLRNASAINLVIGNDGWQNPQTLGMTLNSTGLWEYTYFPFPGLDWINFVFNDGAGTWDNNYASDWNYSVYCPPIDGLVNVTPASPSGCIPITFTYEVVPDSPLENAQNIYINIEVHHVDSIQNNDGFAMTEVSPGVWEYVFQPPPGSTDLYYHFHDYAGAYDKQNKENNWVQSISNCQPDGWLSITNPLAEKITWETPSIRLAGELSNITTTNIVWSNLMNGTQGYAAGGSTWLTPPVPLVRGTNEINVCARYVTQPASDAASDPVYDDGWQVGDNGGSGFGAWHATGNPTLTILSNSGLGSEAWGAIASQYYEIKRPLTSPLEEGDTLAFDLDTTQVNSSTYIDLESVSGSDIGWITLNRNPNEVYFGGPAFNGQILNLPASTTGHSYSLTPLSSTLLQVSISSRETSITLTTNLSFNASSQIQQFSVYKGYNTGSGGVLAINNLAFIPKPSGSTACDNLMVYYAPSMADTDLDGIPDYWEDAHGLDKNLDDASLDLDQDGFTNFEEFIADTNPTNTLSLLKVVDIVATNDMLHVTWQGGTEVMQELQWSTNLLTGPWHSVLTNMPPTLPLHLEPIPQENVERIFYRIKAVRPSP